MERPMEEEQAPLSERMETLEGDDMDTAPARECIVVQTEDEFLAACGSPSGPITVTQKSVKQRREKVLHRVLDGVEDIDVEMEVAAMGIEKAAKVINLLDNSRDVKIDHSITAMALIGMFPVAKEVG